MKDKVLTLLTENGDGHLSGEAMSEALGVSRAAVWKAIGALRDDGYTIEAAPRRGYRLTAAPDRLTKGSVLPYIRGERQRERLICLDTVDSTNNYAKTLAMNGGADGTVIVADEQTGGRGRQGRSFLSPPGMGVYLTMLLKPDIPPQRAVDLTACAAVAVCEGIERAAGVRPGIKWTNDIILDNRKISGILTEMAVEGESGTLQYVITGIGINVNHRPEDFPPDIRPIAASVAQSVGHPVPRGKLCAEVINALAGMYPRWLARDPALLEAYRARCVTTGKAVLVIRGDRTYEAFAEEVDDDFSLVVRRSDGRRETVTSGEVSVRGLCGYI